MASGYGENSKPKATSDEYRNSPYWDKLEAEKKRKEQMNTNVLKSSNRD